jgi:hypothetical protein
MLACGCAGIVRSRVFGHTGGNNLHEGFCPIDSGSRYGGRDARFKNCSIPGNG